jgi:Domain of unknown function (DUF397)
VIIANASSVKLSWRKSSHSDSGGHCIEIAEAPGAVAVRDSKDPSGPALVFPVGALQAFIAAVKLGDFDIL